MFALLRCPTAILSSYLLPSSDFGEAVDDAGLAAEVRHDATAERTTERTTCETPGTYLKHSAKCLEKPS